MRKLIFLFLGISFNIYCQESDKANTLKGPVSISGYLLSLSPSEIASISSRTKLVSEFSQFKTASKNFTLLPKSFAFDIAPLKSFNKESLQPRFWEEWVISIGYKDSTDVNLNTDRFKNPMIALGTGFNFYIGNKSKTQNKAQAKKTMFSKTNATEASKPDERIQFYRGWMGNFSFGQIVNQISQKYERRGAWLTISKNVNKENGDKKEEVQDNIIFAFRYLKNGPQTNESLKENLKNSLDLGFKFTHHALKKDRFFGELEFLYRIRNEDIIISNELKNPDINKIKYDINLGFEIRKNLVITAALGKEFGSSYLNKTGNLFALLNIAGGIGANK